MTLKTISTVCFALLLGLGSLKAQDKTTVTAADSDISENLNLEAVASIFGESKDLEDFEKKLNDPETQISNLDLNGDGEVDYLRVVENSKGNTHVVSIQAVIGKDKYQDVATIDVEKDDEGETSVEVIGDVYMYGPDYVIVPVYAAPPPVVVFFWAPVYVAYRSAFYWGYYPPYFRPWPPYPPHVYRSHVHVHVSVHNTYRHTTVRTSHTAVSVQNQHKRNDYARQNPNNSFEKRNTGSRNKADLQKNRPSTGQQPAKRPTEGSTGRKVDPNWNSGSKDRTHKSTTPSRRPSTSPSPSRPGNSPSQRPSTSPSSRPSTRPSSTPSQRPSTRPSPSPSRQPSRSPSRSGGAMRRR